MKEGPVSRALPVQRLSGLRLPTAGEAVVAA